MLTLSQDNFYKALNERNKVKVEIAEKMISKIMKDMTPQKYMERRKEDPERSKKVGYYFSLSLNKDLKKERKVRVGVNLLPFRIMKQERRQGELYEHLEQRSKAKGGVHVIGKFTTIDTLLGSSKKVIVVGSQSYDVAKDKEVSRDFMEINNIDTPALYEHVFKMFKAEEKKRYNVDQGLTGDEKEDEMF